MIILELTYQSIDADINTNDEAARHTIMCSLIQTEIVRQVFANKSHIQWLELIYLYTV